MHYLGGCRTWRRRELRGRSNASLSHLSRGSRSPRCRREARQPVPKRVLLVCSIHGRSTKTWTSVKRATRGWLEGIPGRSCRLHRQWLVHPLLPPSPRTNGTLPTGFMSATPQPAFQAPLRDITVAPAARGALRGPAAAAPSLIDAGPAARALASPAQPRVAARASCEPSTSARSLSSPAQQSADALASPALLDLRQNHGARGRAPVLEGQAQSELVVMRPKGDRSGGCSTSRHSGVSNCMTTNVLVAQVSCGACKKCAPCPAPQPETEPCHPCPVVY
jgi:hypothetical protein